MTGKSIRNHLVRSLRRSRPGALSIGIGMLALTAAAPGATVIRQGANTEVHFDLTYGELEDPGSPLAGCNVLERLDAGYPCADDTEPVDYEAWTVNNPCSLCDDGGCIDGYDNEIWLRQAGDTATTVTTRPSTAISVNMHGDSNDGRVEVIVDGCSVAELDMFTSPGTQDVLVIATNLPFGTHEIIVKALGAGSGGADDVALMGGTALQCGAPACDVSADCDNSDESEATIDYDDDYMEKALDIQVDPSNYVSARIWLYGKPYNYPNEDYEPREDYVLQLNDDPAQQIRFDVGAAFNYRESEFQWVAFDFPADWLTTGLNTVFLYYDGPTGSWATNNLRVGVDTDNDVDRSWWYGNGVTTCFQNPQNCTGELMITVELCTETIGPALPYGAELNSTCIADAECQNRAVCVASPDGCESECYVPRNRYLSFDTNQGVNAGRPIAFRIDLVDSEYFSDSIGPVGWVGEPDADGLAAVVSEPWVSFVDGGAWPDTVHAAGCEVVPVATYEVIATDLLTEAPALELPTAPKPVGGKFWGDAVGIYDGNAWTPPQGTTNIDDVVAAIKTFQQQDPMVHISWADIEDEETNRLVNINDVFMFILAMQGEEYPYSDPQECGP